MTCMKIALVHDYIKEYGGAERVLEALHELFPHAPVFTTIYCPTYLGPHKKRFQSWDIRTSWLQHIPYKEKLISPLRLLAPSVFNRMDFSAFDVVIVSATGAYESNMINKGTATHVCYCHTPPRYLYGYATARNWKKNPIVRVCGEFLNHFLRNTDFLASKRVDYFIANSHEVAGRIKKFYRTEAVVIYPPIDVPKKVGVSTKHSYFLTGGRLAQAKHIDLAIAACTKLNLPLQVFGKGFAGYGEGLKKHAGPTIEFLGEVTDDKKWQLMQGARAFLFPSEDEDFGIIPVEAMAAGAPVIAYKSGGVQETVQEGKTGVFFNDLSVSSLVEAIIRFTNTQTISSSNCRESAKKYSKAIFQKNIREFLKKLI